MAKQQVIVSVLADTKKFSAAMRNLSRETGLSRLTDGFKRLGSRIADTFKTGIKLAAGLAAGIAALSIKGGIARALDTEDATILMKQLGMSTKDVDKALAMVTKTFAGTPFKNPDGFNFSAQLAASGKGLDQIERDLRTTSNVTAMTLDKDFGQISELFLKMSANSRVTATDLNSIGLAGYPIRQVLADALDTSVEGLNKMVSSGDLSYDKMMELLSGVKELDGAAESLGDSTRMSWSTMLSWFSIVGEAFVTDILPVFKDGFQSISKWLEGLYEPVKAFGQSVATWLEGTALPAVKRLAGWIGDKLWPVLKDVAATVSGAFANAWETVTTALDEAGLSAGDTADSIGETLLTALENLGDILETVIEKIGDLVAWFIEYKDTIITVAAGITAAVVAFQTLNKVFTVVRAATVALQAGLAVLSGPIGLITLAVAALTAGFVWFFTQTEIGQKIATKAWDAIKAGVEQVTEWWGTHVAPLFEDFGELWAALWESVQAIWDEHGETILAVVGTGFENLKTVLSTIWNAIKIVIETVLGVIRGIVKTVTSLLRGDWKGVWEGIRQIASSVWNGIRGLITNQINAVRSVISNVVNGVKSMWSSSWNSVKTTAVNIFGNIKTGVTNKLNALMTFVKSIPTKIKNVFSNAGSWLLKAGRDVINGFINAIKGAFGRVKDTLSSLTGMLPSWKGPASKDRKILAGPGRLIIEGLVDGLEDQYSTVKRSLAGLTRTIAGTGFEPLTAPTVTAGAGRGSGPVEINVYAMSDGPEVGRRVHEALESFYRVNGVR